MPSTSSGIRLDMPTSDLVVIPRTATVARRLRAQFSARHVIKKYYARVVGRFTSTVQECSAPLNYDHKKRVAQVVTPEEGKPAFTRIRRLDYDQETDTSLVLCEPTTD